MPGYRRAAKASTRSCTRRPTLTGASSLVSRRGPITFEHKRCAVRPSLDWLHYRQRLQRRGRLYLRNAIGSRTRTVRCTRPFGAAYWRWNTTAPRTSCVPPCRIPMPSKSYRWSQFRGLDSNALTWWMASSPSRDPASRLPSPTTTRYGPGDRLAAALELQTRPAGIIKQKIFPTAKDMASHLP